MRRLLEAGKTYPVATRRTHDFIAALAASAKRSDWPYARCLHTLANRAWLATVGCLNALTTCLDTSLNFHTMLLKKKLANGVCQPNAGRLGGFRALRCAGGSEIR
jgi:hypothetical protein